MKKSGKCLLLTLVLLLLAAPTGLGAGAEDPGAPMAYASTQSVLINGAPVELQAYALKDENGFLTNYVKIRDMAAAMRFTTAQFDVAWDGTVNIFPGQSYRSPNGQENQCPYTGDRPYYPAVGGTKVNGAFYKIDAFVLRDDDGNGSTYYKLRDLAQVLNFYVSWEGPVEGILIDTSIPYPAS